MKRSTTIDLLTYYPATGETNRKWEAQGTRPLLTVHTDGGLSHTINPDVGFRDGMIVAVDSDLDARVYVFGYPEDGAFEMALVTRYARYQYRELNGSLNFVDADVDDDELSTFEFGHRYRATEEQIAEAADDEEPHLHMGDDGEWYDLDSGYGPTFVHDPLPPIEALAGFIARKLLKADEVTVEEGDPGTLVVTINDLTLRVPRLALGYSDERIRHVVHRLTRDHHEVTLDEKETEALISWSASGFWDWFRRALVSAGLSGLVVREDWPDTLTLVLDHRCASGDDAPRWLERERRTP